MLQPSTVAEAVPGGDARLSSEWVQQLVGRCQVFAGVMAEASVADLVPTVDRLLKDVPAPRNPGEYFVQRSLFLEIALMLESRFHRGIHGMTPRACAFASGSIATKVWQDRRRRAPRELMLEWAQLTTEQLAHDKQFQEIRGWVAAHFAEPASVSKIAKRFDVPPRKVDRAFRVHLGLSFTKYQQCVRMVKALEMLVLDETKVEAAALLIGFKSKKSFYEAFGQFYGMTPGQAKASTTLRDAALDDRVPSPFRAEVRSILATREMSRAMESGLTR